MVGFLKAGVAQMSDDFSTDQRNMLSVGFKNLISSQRGTIRVIGAIEQNPKYTKFSDALLAYKSKIQTELYDKCMEIVNIVKSQCCPLAQNDESKAFFQKMIGDYYRYVAESASADKLGETKNGALEGYNEAQKLCETLNACNPIRIGLALNFSVFHYEIMNDHQMAIQIGEKSLSDALEKIDEVDEETFRDAKSIIELLKENLSLWKEEDENAVDDL